MSAEQEMNMLSDIIQHFQNLDDQVLQTYEPSYVHSVLLTPGVTRNKLLCWVLERLHPTSLLSLESAPPAAQQQKMLNSFSTLGLCKMSDLNVIKGDACSLSQLRFWAAVLESIHHLKKVGVSQTAQSGSVNSFMDNLALSPHLHLTLTESRMGLIDDDLKNEYKLWGKKGPHPSLENLLENTQSELQKKLRYFEDKDKDTLATFEIHKVPIESEDFESTLKDLEAKLVLQGEQCTGLRETFDSGIAPWIGTPQPITQTSRGPLIRQTNTHIQQLIKDLHAVEEVTCANTKLDEMVRLSEQRQQHPPKSMKDLKDLVEYL